ncbi:hypothetical protein [Micromonospora sp. NPDC047730]|uniref:hypothetical protein n=1 Tax=Micromonospora sp. NPDC047730 TaxID=3364253 RepID=UPI003716E9A4
MPADEGLTRRLKALACTVPLHELDARRGKLEWVDASVYQMAEIALHTIDQVTIAMDFDAGATHDTILDRVRPFVAAQAPDRDSEEHIRVIQWVLENLINVGTVDRAFRRVYGEVDADGVYQRRVFDFKLVVELAAPGGGVYLRTTDEAINVLVGALDTDVQSAQVAAEVKLENLISRGKLVDARVAAEQARYRTVQYGEAIRRRLDATRRDVRTVDWEAEIPDLLDTALKHIEERFEVEHKILATIAVARDESEDPSHKRRAAELAEIVSDCVRRHTQLQHRLLSARAIFRAEQDRQQFSGRPQRSTFNLYGQLLTPLLQTSITEAVPSVEAFFRAATGVRVPDVPSLASLVARLLRPAPLRDRTVGPVADPELDVSAVDRARFTDELWQMSDELLDLSGVTRSLSTLLEQATVHGPDLPVLVALRAVHAFSPAVGSAMRHGQRRLLVAVPAGTRIGPRSAGAGGDDLLLTRADVVPKDSVRAEADGAGAVGE